MSFLPSFGAASTSTATSSSQWIYKPASLSYFTIFCPALKPPKKKKKSTDQHTTPQDAVEDEDARETAREAAQILFYTSRARAALKHRMLRQIGVAKGMIEFGSMVSKPSAQHGYAEDESGSKSRSWNVHSSKRRMILVQVEHGVWVHASIDLPYTTRSPPTSGEPRAKVVKEYHDAVLPDAWLEESIRRAWRDWVLLNGCPAHILSQKAGRTGLERSLEKYFSVWAWSWDLELTTNADVVQQRSLFEECVEGFPVVARAPRSKLMRLMQSEAAQRIKNSKHGERDMVILSDTAVLWPPTDAGCFDSQDETYDGDNSRALLEKQKSSQKTSEQGSGAADSSWSSQLMDAQTKAEVLRRVVSHLTGLERERDLVRAASVSSNSDGRKRGTSGAIRERGSSSSYSKRDMRNGLLAAGTSKKRIVSSPIMQQRSTSASSYASSTTESTRWSNWGSVFSGLGKLGLRGNADSSARSETTNAVAEPEASNLSIVTSNVDGADASAVCTADVANRCSCSPMDTPASTRDGAVGGGEASSPLQLLQQKLVEAMPMQEAGGKMWSGAEVAFRGLSASLGLATASSSMANNDEADSLGQEGIAQDGDASFDTNGADGDASVVTKVSILEPEVDVSELAEALGAKEEEARDEVVQESAAENTRGTQQHGEVESTAAAREVEDGGGLSPVTDTRGSDASSIGTSASAKAFPSISVTSAAWYNTKALRSEAALGTTSPKLATAAGIFSTHDGANAEPNDAAEELDTSLGGACVRSEHHDFELDGWGEEQPQAMQSFRCYVGESDVPISYESLVALEQEAFCCTEYRVWFTTRRLLTMVLIEKVSSTTGSALAVEGGEAGGVLDDAWQLLRRTQRMLNDYDRVYKAKQQQENSGAMRFLHVDGATLTFQSSLEDEGEPKLEEEVQVVAEAHCVSAMELMRRHGVVETFSRSSNGKTWTASRQGKRSTHGNKAGQASQAEEQRLNQTYMVLAGKKISIVDCDTELRKLANQYPSFGI